MNDNQRFRMLSYIDRISNKDKFYYLVLIFIIALFIYKYELRWSLWLGLLIGIGCVYYLNERQTRLLSNQPDKLWHILNSKLLNQTKYFVTDAELIQFFDHIGDLKQYNILEFNHLVKDVDNFLKLTHEMNLGITNIKDNLDLVNDLRIKSLNEFHSISYRTPYSEILDKVDKYSEEFARLLNTRYQKLVDQSKTHYNMNPINIDSHFDIQNVNEPYPYNNNTYEKYNFYS